MDDAQQPSLTPPAELRPPGHDRGPGAGSAPRRVGWWLTLAALLTMALAVVFVLPSVLNPPTSAPESYESPPAQPPPAENDTRARDRAQQTLQEFLRLRARMELDNAPAWAGPGWSESAELAASGDRRFAQRQFAAAGRDYLAALERLKVLQAGRDTRLKEALEQGRRALDADDTDGALAAFADAQLIEPEHPEALAGVAAANRRAAALEQMSTGRAAEAADDLATAQGAYRQAAAADPDYAPARAALERVDLEIRARKFTAAMSAALNALDAGRSGVASQALAEAERLRPGDPAVRDARARLQAFQARSALQRLQREAKARVREEDWQAAVAVYRKALAVDPAAAFARTGLQRAEERVKLHAQFDHYLDSPGRLYSANPLANAHKLLAAVPRAPSDEPRLGEKIGRLQALVETAARPVKVMLDSDGQTNVVIYHVGRLGRFETHQLELRPGDYTVVGSRPGYRDVRRVIRVRPGAPLPPVSIRCEESI